MKESVKPIELCISYAHEDESYCVDLIKSLKALQRRGLIKSWYDRDINAGDDWKTEIDLHFDTAQIILLLISVDFISSDYCFKIEMKRAIERHQIGEARVIPIIVRMCDWENIEPLSKLQALPRDGKPVKSWSDHDAAYTDIAKRIGQLVDPCREASQLQATIQSSLDKQELARNQTQRLDDEAHLSETVEDMRELNRLGGLESKIESASLVTTAQSLTYRLALATLATAEQNYHEAQSFIPDDLAESLIQKAIDSSKKTDADIAEAIVVTMIQGDSWYGLGRWEQALESYGTINGLLALHSKHRVGDITPASLANKQAVCYFQRQLELQRRGGIINRIGVFKNFNRMKKTILEYGGPVRVESQVRFGWEGTLREDGVPRPWIKGVYVDGDAINVERRFENNAGEMRLYSRKSSFAIGVITNVSLKLNPFLSWRWKATTLPDRGDLRSTKTNDEAISLAITFLDGERNWRHLFYGWDTNAPIGTIEPNGIDLPIIKLKYYNKVVTSGWEHLDQWVDIKVNVLDDIRRIYKCTEPISVVMLAVYANSQHTGAETGARIGPISFCRE